MIEEILIFGLVQGGTLALLALGFTLIYGVAEVVNMAHGALFMLGAYLFWFLSTKYAGGVFEPIGLDQSLALIMAIILTAIIGVIIYRLSIHPVLEDILASLVVTVGVLVMVEQLISIEFTSQRFTLLIRTYIGGKDSTTIWGVHVTYLELLSFAVSIGLFAGLWIFIKKTKIGTAMRAVAQDREVAMLMGVNTERLYMLTMAISAAFAALAGVLYTATTTRTVEPSMWGTPLYMAFAVVILGGLGSIKGTIIGAFIISYAKNAFTFLVPQQTFLSGAIALAVMVLVLLVRPKGLFGRRIEMEE